MTRFEWGDTVTQAEIGGVTFRTYEPRRRRLAELLLDAARWGDRTHLVQGDRELSFADVFAGISAVARLLREEHGVRPGRVSASDDLEGELAIGCLCHCTGLP